jgi:hypothetical protein
MTRLDRLDEPTTTASLEDSSAWLRHPLGATQTPPFGPIAPARSGDHDLPNPLAGKLGGDDAQQDDHPDRRWSPVTAGTTIASSIEPRPVGGCLALVTEPLFTNPPRHHIERDRSFRRFSTSLPGVPRTIRFR